MKRHHLFSLVVIVTIAILQYVRYCRRTPSLDGPVCSKGYYPGLARDFGLVKQYHSFSTENKVDIDFMHDYVTTLQLYPGFEIWLRAGSHQGGDLLTFVRLLRAENIALPFTLITSDGDNDTSSILPTEDREFLLSCPLLVKWYSQNCTITHPKLFAIPIGLDRHTHPIKFRLSLDLTLQLILGRTQSSIPRVQSKTPIKQIVFDTGGNTHEERNEVRNVLGDPVAHIKILRRRLTRNQLWQQFYGKYIAGISVRGNGYDCHRTWEMIQAGMVPIVRRHGLPFESCFAPFVVFVTHWDEVLNPAIIEKIEVVRKIYPVQLGGCRSFLPCPHDVVYKIAPEADSVTSDIQKQFRLIESQGFRVAFFDHRRGYEFLENNFHPTVVQAFQILPSHRLRCELLQFCLLYTHGGVFIDMQNKLVANLQDILSPITLVNHEHIGTIDTSFVAMCAGSSVCDAFIRITVEESRREGMVFDSREDVGSRLLTLLLSRQMGNVKSCLRRHGTSIVWRDTLNAVVTS